MGSPYFEIAISPETFKISLQMSVISNSIEMQAPPVEVFKIVSDIVAWPRYLPHYRWIRVLENNPDHLLIRMACYRGRIPIDWISQFRADPKTLKLQFNHKKIWTRGMEVVWFLDPINDGSSTRVTITHDMEPVSRRFGDWVAHRLIGGFFVEHVATRTLKNFAAFFSQTRS